METLKKIGAFFALFAIIIGAITSLVLTAQQSLWVAFAGQLCVIAAAVPTLVKVFKFLTDRQQDFPLKVGDEFTTDQGEHLRVIGFRSDGTPKCERVSNQKNKETWNVINPDKSGEYLVKYTIDGCKRWYNAILAYDETKGWLNYNHLGNGKIRIILWAYIPEVVGNSCAPNP